MGTLLCSIWSHFVKKNLDIKYPNANVQCLSIVFTKYQNVPEQNIEGIEFLIQILSKTGRQTNTFIETQVVNDIRAKGLFHLCPRMDFL